MENLEPVSGEIPANAAGKRPFEASGPSVYDYQDYRLFLRDTIEYLQKHRSGGFSLVQFAKALGFSSHSGLAMVLSGKRELRDPYLERCVKYLKLGMKQRLYFDALVRATKLSPAKRRSLLREMQLYSASWEPPEVSEGIRMIDLGLVHMILTVCRGYMTPAQIRSRFRYEISANEIQRILNWMEEHEYVEHQLGNGYRVLKTVMTAKDEKVNSSVKQLHRDCLKLAAAALDDGEKEKREFQSYFVTIDSARILELKQRLKKIVFETIAEFETDLDADTVVQMHFNMFEIVHQLQEKGRE